MADQKISQLSDGGASQAADEYVVARSGANYRIDGASVAAAATSVGTLTSLTVSGDLTVDTNTLKVDSATDKVGIGTTSMVSKLDVRLSGTSSGGVIGVGNTGTGDFGGLGISDGGTYPVELWGSSLSFKTGNSAYASATEKMVLTSAGNLGIGKASPAYRLDIEGASPRIWMKDTTASGSHFEVACDTTAAAIVNRANLPLTFGTNNTERMRLDASGNLGLGVTPSAWFSGIKAFQVNTPGAVFSSASGNYTGIANNYYVDASGNDKFLANGRATSFLQNSGSHIWYTSTTSNSSGAGAALTFTQAMTLDASGNLGVGTASPGNILELKAATPIAIFNQTTTNSNQGIQFQANGSTYGRILNNNATGILDIRNGLNNGDGYLITFSTDGTERARFTSGGYFKASNTGTYNGSTSAYHEILGDGTAGGIVLFVKGAGTSTNNTYNILEAQNGDASGRIIIRDSGNVINTNGSYGTISDIKHKQDVIDAPSQWDDLKAVRFRKFRMKAEVEANPDAPYMLGVIAQELQATSPGLIETTSDVEQVEVTDDDGNVTTEMRPTGTETLSVKSSILLMKAAVALQEAMARIEALEARLEALEA